MQNQIARKSTKARIGRSGHFLNFSAFFVLVAQTLHHLCRATAVALHWFRIFRLMFSQCRTRIALHPLTCLKEGPVAPFWGGCRTLSWPCVYDKIVSRYRGCRSYSVARSPLHCDTKVFVWQTSSNPYLCENPHFLHFPYFGLDRAPLSVVFSVMGRQNQQIDSLVMIHSRIAGNNSLRVFSQHGAKGGRQKGVCHSQLFSVTFWYFSHFRSLFGNFCSSFWLPFGLTPFAYSLSRQGDFLVGNVWISRFWGAPIFSPEANNSSFKAIAGAPKTRNPTTTDSTPHSWPPEIVMTTQEFALA